MHRWIGWMKNKKWTGARLSFFFIKKIAAKEACDRNAVLQKKQVLIQESVP